MKTMKSWSVDEVDYESGVCRLVGEKGETVVVPFNLFEKIPRESDLVEVITKDTDELLKEIDDLMDEVFE